MASGPLEPIGPASDIYLLGAVLFEIVTGKQPHTGPSVMKCLLAAAQNQIVPVPQTGELMSVAYKAMATDPADRYEKRGDFQNPLRQYQSHSESITLAVRAEDDLKRAEAGGDYQTFARSMFGFQEGWPCGWPRVGHDRPECGPTGLRPAGADQGRLRTRPVAARCRKRGALSMARVGPAHANRDARQQRLKNAKSVVGAMVAATALVILAALVMVNREKDCDVAAEGVAKAAEGVAKEQRDLAVEAEGRAKESEQVAKDSAGREKAAAGCEKIAADQARLAEGQAREAKVRPSRRRLRPGGIATWPRRPSSARSTRPTWPGSV